MFTYDSENCCTLAGLKLLMLGQSDKAELCSLLEPDNESMQCRLCEDVHPIEAYDKGPCTFLVADLLTLHRNVALDWSSVKVGIGASFACCSDEKSPSRFSSTPPTRQRRLSPLVLYETHASMVRRLWCATTDGLGTCNGLWKGLSRTPQRYSMDRSYFVKTSDSPQVSRAA